MPTYQTVDIEYMSDCVTVFYVRIHTSLAILRNVNVDYVCVTLWVC